ncbi:hypothetical protein [Streptomyces sp. NPDC057838]|uniref:hypothetical protein n=1 Tax=unclassified Streptomyces TaxID=2593676 RepID=UPI0036B970E8
MAKWRSLQALAVASAAVAALFASSGTAGATDGAGCPSDEVMCYGWSGNWNKDGGVISYFRGNAWDLNLDRYVGSGTGSGEAIGNNNGSLFVNALDRTRTIYYNPSVGGARPSGYNITYGFGVRTCNNHTGTTNWGVLPWYICNNARAHFAN